MDIRKYSPCMFCNDSFKGQSKGVIHTEGEIERGIVSKPFLIKSNVALILTNGKGCERARCGQSPMKLCFTNSFATNRYILPNFRARSH